MIQSDDYEMIMNKIKEGKILDLINQEESNIDDFTLLILLYHLKELKLIDFDIKHNFFKEILGYISGLQITDLGEKYMNSLEGNS